MVGRLAIVSVAFIALCGGVEDGPIHGTVADAEGKPLVGVDVYGSVSKKCCPFKRERTVTNDRGQFQLDAPGSVIHFRRNGLQPRSLIVTSEMSNIRVTLQPSANDLTLRNCGPVKPGTRRVGWGSSGLQFDLPERDVQILGGKPDEDYVRYVIKRSGRASGLELWFGPMAFNSDPWDEDFLKSAKFSQRGIGDSKGNRVGLDSYGNTAKMLRWRHTAVVSSGARYADLPKDDADFFDGIIDSFCSVPYPR